MQQNKQPKVSVIIATYNRAPSLLRSVQSVLRQTYQNMEIIIVDDGSTDHTQEIVKNINDARVRYVRNEKNKGAAAARNTGICLATGKYIAFQDDDDEWVPGKLQIQIDVLEQSSSRVDIVYSDMWKVRQGQRTYFHSPRFTPSDGIIYKHALADGVGYIGLVTVVLRKECFDKAGLFDENLSSLIDYELFIRLSKDYYFHHIDEPLAIYYATHGSITANLTKVIQARRYIMNKYSSHLLKDKRLSAKHWMLLVRSYCDSGSTKNGFECLLKGIYYSRFRLSYVAYFVWRSFLAAAQLLTGENAKRIRRKITLRYYASKYSKRKVL